MGKEPFYADEIRLAAGLFVFFIFSCGEMAFSPFQSDVPEEGLTDENLSRIETLPRTSEFRIALIADTHDAYADFDDAARDINLRGDVAFTVHLGDSTDAGIKEEYVRALDVLKRLDMPFLTVIGNHDCLSNGKDIYKKIFGRFDYSFSLAGTKFIVLNSNRLEFPGEAVPDFQWLDSELASGRAYENIIVFSHAPPATVAPNGFTEEDIGKWRSLMEKHGAQLLISGDFHRLSSETQNGVLYLSIPDVRDVHYGILTVNKEGISYEQCHRLRCEPVL